MFNNSRWVESVDRGIGKRKGERGCKGDEANKLNKQELGDEAAEVTTLLQGEHLLEILGNEKACGTRC